jgi:hypothetical protein
MQISAERPGQFSTKRICTVANSFARNWKRQVSGETRVTSKSTRTTTFTSRRYLVCLGGEKDPLEKGANNPAKRTTAKRVCANKQNHQTPCLDVQTGYQGTASSGIKEKDALLKSFRILVKSDAIYPQNSRSFTPPLDFLNRTCCSRPTMTPEQIDLLLQQWLDCSRSI